MKNIFGLVCILCFAFGFAFLVGSIWYVELTKFVGLCWAFPAGTSAGNAIARIIQSE